MKKYKVILRRASWGDYYAIKYRTCWLFPFSHVDTASTLEEAKQVIERHKKIKNLGDEVVYIE